MTSLFWIYGKNDVPVKDITRHYADLNLQLTTVNFSPGEKVGIKVKYPSSDSYGNSVNYITVNATIGGDGSAKLKMRLNLLMSVL